MTYAVRDSHELRRILALPRRVLTLEHATAVARDLTPLFALRGADVALRPWQGVVLHELMACNGCYAGLPVGQGKTLLSWLAPRALDAARPVVCMPAGHVEERLRDFGTYSRSWIAPNPPPTIVTYESLTRIDSVDMLDRIQPDMLILDEAHRLRNLDGSAPKRIDRYVRKHRPKVLAFTGTPGRLSLLDYAHLLIWCLDDGAPIPLVRADRDQWACALDEKDPRAGGRLDLGALCAFGSTLEDAQVGFGQRLAETPGVVMVDEDSCDQPLTIRTVPAPEDHVLDAHFQKFRTEWVTPDGWEMSDALSVYRHAGELGTGMYLRYDPRPPDEWANARREFCRFVRRRIQETSRAHRPLDTELAVIRAHKEAPEVMGWLAVRDTFTPRSVPVWVSGSVLRACVEWLSAPDGAAGEPALIWCGNVAFGETLATMAGLKYYGPEGKDATGASIIHLPGASNRRDGVLGQGAERSAVVSLNANRDGRNLQGWARHLVVNPPQSGLYLEQLLGRPHRADQTRPVVFDIMITSGDIADSFEAAFREAAFGARTNTLTQKVLRARIERASVDLSPTNAYRWARKE